MNRPENFTPEGAEDFKAQRTGGPEQKGFMENVREKTNPKLLLPLLAGVSYFAGIGKVEAAPVRKGVEDHVSASIYKKWQPDAEIVIKDGEKFNHYTFRKDLQLDENFYKSEKNTGMIKEIGGRNMAATEISDFEAKIKKMFPDKKYQDAIKGITDKARLMIGNPEKKVEPTIGKIRFNDATGQDLIDNVTQDIWGVYKKLEGDENATKVMAECEKELVNVALHMTVEEIKTKK